MGNGKLRALFPGAVGSQAGVARAGFVVTRGAWWDAVALVAATSTSPFAQIWPLCFTAPHSTCCPTICIIKHSFNLKPHLYPFNPNFSFDSLQTLEQLVSYIILNIPCHLIPLKMHHLILKTITYFKLNGTFLNILKEYLIHRFSEI